MTHEGRMRRGEENLKKKIDTEDTRYFLYMKEREAEGKTIPKEVKKK